MSLITKIEFIDDPKGKSFLKGVEFQLHDYLTDDADWDAEYWEFDAEYIKQYSKLLESMFTQSEHGIEFQALWVGDTPKIIIELPLTEFLEVVENNNIETKTKYVVRKNA